MTPDRIVHRDNGYRVFSPRDALRHLVSALASHRLSFRFRDLTRASDLGFHVVAVESDPALDDYTRQSHLHFGKGSSRDQARASGMFEAVERYSSIFIDERKTLHGSYRGLAGKGHALLDPYDHLLPTAGNLRSRRYFSSDVKSLYRHDRPITWYQTRSLPGNRPVYLPVCLTHTLRCDDRANRIYSNRPNGLSSGMTLEEATLQGLLEVVERDCECIFVGNSLPMPTVRLDSLRDRSIAGALDRASRHGVDVTIKYIANDIGLPTFYTMLFDPRSGHKRICWGTGTHLSKRIALYRSLTEAVQDRACREYSREAFLGTPRPDVPPDCRWEARRYYDLETGKADHAIDYLYRPARPIRYDEIRDLEYDSLRAAIRGVLKRLEACGIRQVYVADLTRFDIPTVRVIAPELEFMPKVFYGFRRRGARSRRLFQVPLTLGYREGIDFEYRSGLGNNFLI